MYPHPRSPPAQQRGKSQWPDFVGLVVAVIAMAIAYYLVPGENWMRRLGRMRSLPLEAFALGLATTFMLREKWTREVQRGIKLWIPLPGPHFPLWWAIAGAFAANLFNLLDVYARLGVSTH
jgi:hypothetical protein